MEENKLTPPLPAAVLHALAIISIAQMRSHHRHYALKSSTIRR